MMQTVKHTFFCAFMLLSIFFIASCRPEQVTEIARDTKQYNMDAALDWQKLMLDISRYTPGARAAIQARALGYIGLAGYEAAVPGMSKYSSLAAHFPALKLPRADANQSYHWGMCVHSAYSTIINAIYPNLPPEQLVRVKLLTTEMDNRYTSQIVDNAVYERSKKFGTDIANAIYAWSITDVQGHDAYLRAQPEDYVPPTGAGKWQPSAPDYSRAYIPYWGKVRTFALSSVEKLSPPPVPYSTSKSSEYYRQGLEVYSITASLSAENQWIAEFWSDDNFQQCLDPSTRWISILNQALVHYKANLETAVLAYAKVGLALSDAGVACWYSKYTYNVERPMQYIRANFDTKWVSMLNYSLAYRKGYTPSAPSYPSGHATFGSAAADAMISVFGSDAYYDYDKTHEGRTDFNGKPRFFKTFTQMAEENAFSRIPLGVHFRMDCDEGFRLGKVAAKRINELKWLKK
jgi:membrane-associated phospholipid phosphatase